MFLVRNHLNLDFLMIPHGMKSDEKLFFCQIYAVFFLRKIVHVVIDRYFPLFLKGLKIFLSPMLPLIVPLINSRMLLCERTSMDRTNLQQSLS